MAADLVAADVSQSHKEIPPQAGSFVWAAVERVERDAILTNRLGGTESTPSSLACLAGLLVPLYGSSFGSGRPVPRFLPLHFRLYFRGIFVGVLMSVLVEVQR